MPSVQRPTVSFLVQGAGENREPGKVFLIKFRTKRHGGYGVPGGGKEIDDSVMETAVKEAREELGIELLLDSLILFAIRDYPCRDVLRGKKLSKYVSDLPREMDIQVDTYHNLDFVVATKTLYDIDPLGLVPGDKEEVERIVLVDALHPPTPLPISDDLDLLRLFGDFCRSGKSFETHQPIFMS